MASCDKRYLGRELPSFGSLNAAATCLEEFFGIHSDPNLDHAEIFSAARISSDLVADGVDVVSDELMLAKAIQTGDLKKVWLDNFHFLFAPSPAMADEHASTPFRDSKLNFYLPEIFRFAVVPGGTKRGVLQ